MNVSISGRHIEVTPGLRGHIEERLQKLTTHFEKAIKADVTLGVEKHRHIAEMNLHANGVRIHGKEASLDMYASVDAVLHKIERQCLKYKGRINRHQPRTTAERMYEHTIITPGEAPVEESHEAQRHTEVHREKVAMKKLSVDEAVLLLELTDEQFLVFLEAGALKVNVLYKRPDGTFGLIEPEG